PGTRRGRTLLRSHRTHLPPPRHTRRDAPAAGDDERVRPRRRQPSDRRAPGRTARRTGLRRPGLHHVPPCSHPGRAGGRVRATAGRARARVRRRTTRRRHRVRTVRVDVPDQPHRGRSPRRRPRRRRHAMTDLDTRDSADDPDSPAANADTGTGRLGASYYKLFTGTVVSNLGDGMGTVAYPWLASAITR